jgi:hypothetical protein
MPGIRVLFTCDFLDQNAIAAGRLDMIVQHDHPPPVELLKYLEESIETLFGRQVLLHRWQMLPEITRNDIYLTHTQELPLNARHSRSPN